MINCLGREEKIEGAAFSVGRGGTRTVLFKKPKCDHSGKVEYEKSHCLELIGYPQN